MSVRSTLELDTGPYKKGMKEVEQVSEQTAKKQSGVWAKEGKKAGGSAAQEIVKGIQERLRAKQAQLKDQFARGLIDKETFRKSGKEAAAAFNKEVLKSLDDMQKKGKISREEFTRLAGSLKAIGVAAKEAGKKGGSSFGQMAKTMKQVKLLAVGVIAVLAGSRIVQWFGSAAREGTELAKSFLKLSAGAKLFGVTQQELNALSQHGVEGLQLTIREANELAVTTAKLTSQAEQRTKSQELLNSVMDLGAAQGLDAIQINEALNQALLGIDEGTDKLLQKNPSAIYKEYAASLGTTAGKLTDVQKKQAIVNAVIEAGTKVQGEYQKFLDDDIGKLSTFGRLLQSSKEKIGTGLIPILAKLADLLQGPLSKGVDVMVGMLDRIDRLTSSPLENLLKDLRRVGIESEALARTELALRRLQIRDELDTARMRTDLVQAPIDAGVGQIGTRIRQQGTYSDRLRLDVSDVVSPTLLEEVERVTMAVEAAAKDGQAKRARQLADYQVGLLEIIAVRESELSLTQELADVESDLAAIRSGKGVPGGVDEPPPPGTSIASPILLSNLERMQFATERLEEAEDRLREARKENKADEAAQATQDLAAAQRDLDAAIRDTTAAVQAQSVTPAGVDVFLPDVEQVRIAQEALKTLKEDVLLLLSSGYKPLSLALGEVERMVNLVAQAETNLRNVRLSGGGADEIRAAEEALAAQKEELRARIADVAQALQDAGIQGERLRKIMDLLAEASGDAGLDLDEQTKDWTKWAEAVEGGARMVLSVADAMGILDENTRRALQGVIDIAAGLSKIDFSDLSSSASMGGMAMAAGGGIALVSSFLSALDQTEEQAKQIEEMRRLRQAMEDLREAVLSTVSGEELAGVLGPANTLGEELTKYGSHGLKIYKPQGELKAAAKLMGVSVDEALRIFDEMERLSGLKIFDSKEGLLTANFLAALEQLNQTDLGLFPDTIQGQIEAMAFKWSLLGDAAGDATQKFDEFLKVIGEIEGGAPFADALKRALEDGGPDAANALIDSWTKRVAEGDQSLFQEGGVFFGLTGDEVRELLQSGNDLIEEWLNSSGATSKSVQIGQSITEVQAVEVVAWLQDIAYGIRELVAIQKAAAGMVSNTASLGAAMNSQPSALSQAYSQVQNGAGGAVFDFRGSDFSVRLTEEDIRFLKERFADGLRKAAKERGS